VQRDDRLGFRADDLLESGDMPGVVRDAVRRVRGAPGGPELPRDVMNAPALLNEIRHHTAAFREGMAAHVVNLTLLPISPADHAALDAFLGEGAVSILSRGFGNCRISSTRLPHAWRVRYFNSMNTVILDTVEVVDLPEAARATEEDLAESIERLRELVAWMREP
jgi:hydrogenase-1 operon protein HyaF